jgi:hypothetical protein
MKTEIPKVCGKTSGTPMKHNPLTLIIENKK